ncbi:hypothetical protein V8E36_000639 [Tilletia maclaganii]
MLSKAALSRRTKTSNSPFFNHHTSSRADTMSSNANCLLFPTDVPSLPGPECSFYAPSPNASLVQRLRQCCNNAQLHHSTEVAVEDSCITWCSYPDFKSTSITPLRSNHSPPRVKTNWPSS